jgi:CBS-domain-containing membrane protein
MEERHIHHLPVLDRSNNLVGIVSLSDLALRGPQNLYPDVSKLAFQSALLRHVGATRLAN